MIEVLCMFLPPFLSFRSSDDELGFFLKIKKYIKFNVLTNFLVLFIIFLKTDYKDLEINRMFTISVAPKYLILASFIAYFLPGFLSYIRKNYSFKIIKEKARKNEKGKKYI